MLLVVGILVIAGTLCWFFLLRKKEPKLIGLSGTLHRSGYWIDGVEQLFVDGDDGKRYWIGRANAAVWTVLSCLNDGDRIDMVVLRRKTTTSKGYTPLGEVESYEGGLPSDYTIDAINIALPDDVLFARFDSLSPKRRELVLDDLSEDNPSGTSEIVARYRERVPGANGASDDAVLGNP